jgi:hypothetical protein
MSAWAATMVTESSTHSLQMKTPGPATIVLTSELDLPQNEHDAMASFVDAGVAGIGSSSRSRRTARKAVA